MVFNYRTIHEFNDHFKDELTCYRWLEQLRWDSNPVCPHCASTRKPYIAPPRGKFKDIPTYRCSEPKCKLTFTVRTGSIFEGSKVELRKWFQAVYEISTSKKGISSVELATRIAVSQKTAWFMNHRIRTMLANTAPEIMAGETQADEKYVGGREKNKHKSRRVEGSQGRSTEAKTPVVGLYNDGNVKTFVVESVNTETLKGIIEKAVEKKTTVVTDGLKSYYFLDKDYDHVVVDHSSGEYVKNGFHTNGIENFWSILSRGITGIFHSVSKQHLHRYCNEFEVRYNHRRVSNIHRFDHLLKQTNQPRVTYSVLTSTARLKAAADSSNQSTQQ